MIAKGADLVWLLETQRLDAMELFFLLVTIVSVFDVIYFDTSFERQRSLFVK